MTTVTKLGTAALLGIACLVLGTKPCSAEWFGDVYVGASLTDKHDVTVHDRAAGLATYRDVEFDTALAYGLRFGRYLDSVPFLGFGVDYFNFLPNIGPQSVRVDPRVSIPTTTPRVHATPNALSERRPRPAPPRTPLGASCASLTRLYGPLNSGRVKPSR